MSCCFSKNSAALFLLFRFWKHCSLALLSTVSLAEFFMIAIPEKTRHKDLLIHQGFLMSFMSHWAINKTVNIKKPCLRRCM